MSQVLYISYDGLTDPIGQSQVLAYIVGLCKQGHSFTILSAEKSKVFESEKETVEKICIENNIRWVPIFYTKKPPIFSTLWDVFKMNKQARKLQKQFRFDIVHCRSYISSLIGLKMKRHFRLKFIFDMRGFWADERVDGRLWNLRRPHYNLVYKYFKKKENQFLSEADAVVALTHEAKNIMVNQWHVKKPIHVIPCAVDTDLFAPAQKPTRSNEQTITLGYLGSIGTWYMLGEMLDFFKVFLQRFPRTRLKFITKESPQTVLLEARKKGISEDCIIVKAASRNQVPAELADVDLGLFFIRPLFSKKSSSPIKQGEFMAMGIPVFTNSGIGDTDEIIKKYNSGILISDFSVESYTLAVEKAEKLMLISKDIIRAGAIEYFSLENGINSYSKLYHELTV